MYETAYDLVALGMRYFFAALILYILIRVVIHSLSEYRSVQQIKRQVKGISPGYLEVLAPEELARDIYHLRHENTIGSGKRCDISIALNGLAPTHAFLSMRKDGCYLATFGSQNKVWLNDELVGAKQDERLYTADKLQMGELVVLLHLYGEEAEDDADA